MSVAEQDGRAADIESPSAFYLGRTEDGAPYTYPQKNLLTHGVVIGMTGSGKTGLSVALLEEAAIDGIPSLVIDPKGDLSNLLLTFPALDAASFAPFVPEGEDPEAIATKWREGLAASHQTGERVARLRAAADVAIFTPGSKVGIPISIMASLAAPPADLIEDSELFRERVSTVATSLLGLVGIDADPLSSREHILLSTLLAGAWEKGEDVDLAALVLRIREPGIKKVGVLDLESFFPEKERFSLAVTFNNLLAAPGFSAWLEGVPLDIAKLLRTPEGKPRVAVVSIAHLGDAERMFFVSILLSQVVSWMRAQSGTTSLRALLFMDEIVGYFPPVKNPPSKAPLMLLLKQARAFGLGVLLATQNPVDIDYKGLSNCGTWFVGRLQTERDKARVLEGLEGTSPGAGFDKAAVERTLAGLPPRTFVVHDVREPGPFLFESRFTMSYLRGPLRRDEIKKLMAGHPLLATKAAPEREKAGPGDTVVMDAQDSQAPRDGVSTEKPAVPDAVREVFFPAMGPEPTYVPVLVGSAQVRFSDAKSDLEHAREVTFVTPLVPSAVPADWARAKWSKIGPAQLVSDPVQGARFAELPKEATKAKSFAAWEKAFVSWLCDTQGLARPFVAKWKLYGAPGESEASFRAKVDQKLREERDEAIAKLNAKYQTKFEKLRAELAKAHGDVVQRESDARFDNVGSALSLGASVLSAFGGGGRRILGSAAGVARNAGRIQRAKSTLEDKRQKLADLQAKGQALDLEYRTEAQKIANAAQVPAIDAPIVKPKKTGIEVRFFALAWLPV